LDSPNIARRNRAGEFKPTATKESGYVCITIARAECMHRRDHHNSQERKMKRKLSEKSSIEQIRARFDQDVERFSRLETGQQATVDAPLVLNLVAQAAATHLKRNGSLLDIGCGAGNFSLSILEKVNPIDCTLVDLSIPMLTRAQHRVSAATAGKVQVVQGDMRALNFADGSFDVILAGAVLHHLRDDLDWEQMFRLLFRWLRPGGLLFVADLVTFEDSAVNDLMWNRYRAYLESLGGPAYREKVMDYIEVEDSPRSLTFQFRLLSRVGFRDFDVLHRNSVFAAYFARK